MEKYDLIVIGGGPGGYTSALEGAKNGLKTLLIEGGSPGIGGTCLNEGCIPTKTMLSCAKIYDNAKNAKNFGISGDISIDHLAVLKRKERVIKVLQAGVMSKLKSQNVDIITGLAAIGGKDEKGFFVSVNGENYVCENIVVATGSSSVFLPIDGVKAGIDSGFVITSKEALSMDDVPGSMCVIGGGVIGLEMAAYYLSLGTNVYIIELLDKIGGPIEEDISKLLQKEYEKKGAKFYLGALLKSIGDGFIVFEKGGSDQKLECGRVLLCVGRRRQVLI